jgi:hypothetical protein
LTLLENRKLIWKVEDHPELSSRGYLRGDAIRPITAYTAPRWLQKLYMGRRGE